MKKIIISTMFSLSFMNLANAGEKIGELKSSATIEATCLISTNQIGFGSISLPLLAQSAQSEMNVKCSNASAYTIDLAYGGIYGSGKADSGYTIKYTASDANKNQYNVSNSSGIVIGHISCGFSGTYANTVYFTNAEIANLYNSTVFNKWAKNSEINACENNGSQSGSYPKGWFGKFNNSGTQSIGGSSYDYGIMNGISKGDKLAYVIQIPGDVNKVWNSGLNSFKSTGTGDNQIIPLIAKIVPDKSGSKFPAPDMYLDTVTAVISY